VLTIRTGPGNARFTTRGKAESKADKKDRD